MDVYRPAQRRKGRRLMLSFEVINTLSFSLLAGNLITLLMLRLEATPSMIGLLSAFPYLAFLFMPLAKSLVPKWGLVGIFGRAWVGRNAVIIPILAAPLVVSWAGPAWGIGLILVPYMLFQIVRGFGLVSISPLNSYLSAGKDQGDWLSLKSMVVSTSSIATGILVGLLLGPDAPLERYSLVMAVGILLGFLGSSLIFAIPEPRDSHKIAKVPFLNDLKAGWKDLGFRRFIGGYALLIFLTGLGRPFLIVYAKQVYHFGDDGAMILTVIGTVGAIAMGTLSRTVMDQLGSKPMLVLWNLGFFLSLAALSVMPVLGGAPAWVGLSLLFFLNTLGGSGIENASQSYFFQVVKPDRQFNLGMVYYLIMGITGAMGALMGGLTLDVFRGFVGPNTGFSWFFGLTAGVSLVALIPLSRMANLGARSVGDALGKIFSPRDLKTMNLLRKLDHSASPAREEALMRRMPGSNSDLAVEDSLKRLSSPLHNIRAQALLSLERLPINREVEMALIHHVELHPFATAYRAARILGERGTDLSLGALRRALTSEDYLLQAHAATALGHLEDTESRPQLEALLESEQALVVVHSISALKELGDPRSFGPILNILARRSVPPFLRDEVVFGLARLWGHEAWLYPYYLDFLENPETGLAHMEDLVESKLPLGEKTQFLSLLRHLQGTKEGFFSLIAPILKEGQTNHPHHSDFLHALEEASPLAWEFPRFRYFATASLIEIYTKKQEPLL